MLLFVVLLIFANQTGIIHFDTLFSTLISNPRITLLCVVLTLVSYGILALRLMVLLKLIDVRLSFFESVKVTMLSQFAGTIFAGPLGAEATRFGVLLKRGHARFAELATILVVDRALGLTGLVLPLFVLPFFAVTVAERISYHHYVISVFLLIVATLLLLLFAHRVLAVDIKVSIKENIKVAAPKLYIIVSQLARMFRAVKLIVAYPATLVTVVVLSVCSGLAPLIGYSELVAAFLPNLFDFPSRILILATTMIINGIGVTPGGVGVGEGVFALLGHLTTGKSALSFIETFLAIRMVSMGCALLGGLFLLNIFSGNRTPQFKPRTKP